MPTESIGASLDPRAVLAGIGGALVGLAVGVVFTEIVFANDASWPDVVPIALAAAGWLVARELVRRHHSRKPGVSGSRAAGA